MSILSNWVFWVVIFAIIFILAVIGYITESRKKEKKAPVELKTEAIPAAAPTPPVDNSNVLSPVDSGAVLNLDNGTWNNNQPVENVAVQSGLADDWSVMPEVSNSNVQNMDASQSGVPFPASETPVVEPAPVAEPVVETPAVEPAPVAEPVVETPVVEPAPVAEPVVETPAVEPAPVAEPVVETPAVEPAPVAEPVVETPVVEATPVVEPASEAPVVEAAPTEQSDTDIWK